MKTATKTRAPAITHREPGAIREQTPASHKENPIAPAPSQIAAKKICVVGLGYIGLPTASLLANRGFQVHGVDINEETVRTVNAGGIHIQEPELDVLVSAAVHSGKLKASTVPAEADVFILAVPTPFKDGHQPDLSYIEAATRAIAPNLKAGNLVILESTSPVGTTEKVAAWLAEERPDLARGKTGSSRNGCPGLFIAHCPERVLPGQIMKELVENDRIVGGIDEASTKAAISFYQSFVTGKILAADSRTAEMCKLAENTFRDINIAYANELSIICDKLDINVWDLIRLANHHPRVNILQPGPGVGGHCIAVDPWFIVSEVPAQARLIRTARDVNDGKPQWVVDKIKQIIAEFLLANPEKREKDVTLACFGLTFKPDVDDLRESPALGIAETLAGAFGGKLLLVEPNIEELPTSLAQHEKAEAEYAIENADILVLLVAHRTFNGLSEKIRPGQILFSATAV